MKKYINTSNYYLSTTTSTIPSVIANKNEWHFDVSDITVDGVTLPLKGYYWVDVDFGDVSKREIFRVYKREWYRLFFDDRISPSWAVAHASGASVGLRDFSQLLNSLSTNTDNFWEVEQTGPLSILVRGWVVYHTSNMNAEEGKIVVDDLSFDNLATNSTIYIVLEYDETPGIWWTFATKSDTLLKESGQYPIAKIITWSSSINTDLWIIDLRPTVIGVGNMRAEVYDPDWLAEWQTTKDVFDMDNMKQSTDWEHLFVNQAQVDLRNSYQEDKQDKLISWENIVTISGKSIIDPSVWPNGNVSLDTVLTCWWSVDYTEYWAEEFNDWTNLPLSDNSFLVLTDSGTVLFEWEWERDYQYNSETHTITFNSPLASNERAIIWTMYNNSSSSVWIWDWHITIKWWDGEWQQKTFHVNQDEDDIIDIWEAANDSTITIKQWWIEDQEFTTNQETDSNINLQWIIDVTQEEYDDLPESKLTDNNWYFIYEE